MSFDTFLFNIFFPDFKWHPLLIQNFELYNVVVSMASTNLLNGLHGSCNTSWTSATELIKDIKLNNLNVTDVITACEHACSTIFESDKPPGVSLAVITIVSY